MKVVERTPARPLRSDLWVLGLLALARLLLHLAGIMDSIGTNWIFWTMRAIWIGAMWPIRR